MRDRKTAFWLIPAFCLFLSFLGTASGAEESPELIKIGVLAKRGPERCLEKWGPTAEYLSNEIPGRLFSITPLSFDEVYPAAERKEIDFFLANPSFYVGLEHLCGATRIATLKNLRTDGAYTIFGGVIFCGAARKDIECLVDLKDKTFMAVEKKSFGWWNAGWLELKEQGIDPFRDFAHLSFG